MLAMAWQFVPDGLPQVERKRSPSALSWKIRPAAMIWAQVRWAGCCTDCCVFAGGLLFVTAGGLLFVTAGGLLLVTAGGLFAGRDGGFVLPVLAGSTGFGRSGSAIGGAEGIAKGFTGSESSSSTRPDFSTRGPSALIAASRSF